MCGRILGYMMLEAPTDDGRDNVQREVNSRGTDEELQELARFYATQFLLLLKKGKNRSSRSSSNSSNDDTQRTLGLLMEEATKSNSAVKRLTLIRDNYSCVVTGGYDFETYKASLARGLINDSRHLALAITKVAHILPYSLKQDDIQRNEGLLREKAPYPAFVWTAVEHFGQVERPAEPLNDPPTRMIHPVENVLTMDLSAHKLFGTLQLWLEATDVPDTYTVRASEPLIFSVLRLPPTPRQVTLTSTDPSIPLPNPHYLKIHAACAKVAVRSGVGEYLEAVLEEEEERPVLRSDGGSADVLSFLLARAALGTR
ncbi:hypothetical protein FRB90_011302 [Tulasnella sp. 427]|nr:hypothetical protein FRB90_011302 [Tulasnella sp. 427]